MDTEWSPGEDLRPGAQLLRKQPEVTARGRVWTQLVWFEIHDGYLDGRFYTQLMIRETSGDLLIDNGRIWPVVVEDDGA